MPVARNATAFLLGDERRHRVFIAASDDALELHAPRLHAVTREAQLAERNAILRGPAAGFPSPGSIWVKSSVTGASRHAGSSSLPSRRIALDARTACATGNARVLSDCAAPTTGRLIASETNRNRMAGI